MRPFEYIAPETVEDAVAVLADRGGTVLAGGTDLMVDLKDATDGPSTVVDVSRIAEMRGIEMDGDELRIGAATTHTEIIEDPLVADHVPAMASAAETIGAVQTRNMGTLGGNLVTCVPSLDSGPVLLALDAEVTLAGPDGSRRMPLAEFFVGPRRTALEPGELLVDLRVPQRMLGRPSSFWKFGLRKGQALALVNAAASFELSAGRISDARIALGAVAPTVIRAPEAEAALDGAAVGDLDGPLARAADLAVAAARPIDDFRASADYRRKLIRVGVRRVVEGALESVSVGAGGGL